MAWASFLANEFMEGCFEAQENNSNFHYVWLLVLITLEIWRPPPNEMFETPQQMDFVATKYYKC